MKTEKKPQDVNKKELRQADEQRKKKANISNIYDRRTKQNQ